MKQAEVGQKMVIPTPFAADGDRREFGTNDAANVANFPMGIPSIYSLDIKLGGKHAERQDVNGIGYMASKPYFDLQNGQLTTFDSRVADAIGGYPTGAKLWYMPDSNHVTMIQSQVDDNKVAPSANTVDVKSDLSGNLDNTTGILRWKTVISESQTSVPSINVPLLTPMWFDHECTANAWMNSPNDLTAANGYGWKTKSSYNDAYLHILGDLVTGSSVTETIAGVSVTYVQAVDGHKIIVADGLADDGTTAADSLMAACGVAWFYVLDRTNLRFRLPRTMYGLQGVKSSGAVGKYDAAGLPKPTITLSGGVPHSHNGAPYVRQEVGGVNCANPLYYVDNPTATVSSDTIYGSSTTVQPPATEMLLYFSSGIENDAQGGVGGGVIDGTLLKEITRHTPLTTVSSDAYIVSNDCLLSISYKESTGGAVITVKVNNQVVERGQIGDFTGVEWYSKSIAVKKGSSIIVEKTNGNLSSVNFSLYTEIKYSEYSLTSIAPQIAMPDYAATPTTVTSGWTATENGWFYIFSASTTASGVGNQYVTVNGSVVYQNFQSVGDSEHNVWTPASKNDTISFTGLGLTIKFYPCKTVQQVNPPVWLDKTGKDAGSDNNWWRLYSDNFIEQGGTAAAGALVITLPKPMKDANYQIYTNGVAVGTKTATGFTLASPCDWLVKGYIV